jgi:hypothetical protein
MRDIRVGAWAILAAGLVVACGGQGTGGSPGANGDAAPDGSEPDGSTEGDAQSETVADAGGGADADATTGDATTDSGDIDSSDAETTGSLDGSSDANGGLDASSDADSSPGIQDASVDAPIDAACSVIGLNDDSANCGACGNSCGAGVCTAGHCTTILATKVNEPQGVAVDDSHLFFASPDYSLSAPIFTIPLAGGTPTALVSPPPSPSVSSSTYVTRVGTKLFWTAGGIDDEVFSAPTGGGAATRISNSEMLPGPIVSDGTTVYWLDRTRIRYAPIATGTPATLNVVSDAGTPFDTPTDIAVDGTYVYWGNQSSAHGTATIWRANKTDGSGAVALATGLDPVRGITIDSSTLYFTSSYPLTTHGVYSIPIGGGTPTPLVTTESDPSAIVSDATAIYWIDGGNRIRKMVKGGAATTLATYTGYVKTKIAEIEDASAAFLASQGNYKFLTVDSSYVYWSDDGGGAGQGYIAKVPKN